VIDTIKDETSGGSIPGNSDRLSAALLLQAVAAHSQT
jgi:hypothetical protein